ncbi:hypothetical protein [Neptuniibacter sp.]|uniref:hypothetical protein n=1 Tax=Neptuniibacter sp. TaxID=1962643 RepID=UPI002625DF7D|nr:hypothetical protein [Neptuniibacter sp.]MCP4597028.1 hypothetical protein [Neptuniibacter sp.]
MKLDEDIQTYVDDFCGDNPGEKAGPIKMMGQLWQIDRDEKNATINEKDETIGRLTEARQADLLETERKREVINEVTDAINAEKARLGGDPDTLTPSGLRRGIGRVFGLDD